tara:strand:- start:1050 stop:2738 length:1689 start_codon:yes stop_codon:yes gene_type:complete
MLTNLIENRGKEFSNLIKIGDYLARTLRENVELFSVEDGVATYLTENGSVVSGKYSFKPTLKLSKIVVEDADILENQKAFEEATDKRVMNVLSNLMEDDYQTAEGSFDKILSMYETKLTYERIKDRIQEKTERFGESTKIISSNEFQRVNEIRDQLVTFLKENEELLQSTGMKTGMKLINLVSTSFDLPKRTIDQIQEAGEVEVKFIGKTNLYEHLCRKELIQKELLEAKQNFENIWVNTDSVQDLASMIFESDTDNVTHQVAQVISDAPYLALATRKQINSLLSNTLSMNEVKVTQKDLNKFAGIIYEMKKPVKQYVLDVLNEKYGIDVRKLDEVPTFKTLALTESEIITQIAKHASTGSIIEKTLSEFVNSLTTKNGAEAIDLAVFLEELFQDAGHGETLNEASLMDYMDFTKVADDLGKIGQVLKMLVPAVENAAEELKDEADEEAAEGAEETDSEDPLGTPDELDSGAEVPMGKPNMDAEEAAEEVRDEKEEEEEEDTAKPEEQESEEDEKEGEKEDEMDQDDLTSLLSKLEDLLSDIKPDDDEEDEEEKEDPEQYKT